MQLEDQATWAVGATVTLNLNDVVQPSALLGAAAARIAHPSTFEDSPLRSLEPVSASQASSSSTLPSTDTEYLYRGVGSRSPTPHGGSVTPLQPVHPTTPTGSAVHHTANSSDMDDYSRQLATIFARP